MSVTVVRREKGPSLPEQPEEGPRALAKEEEFKSASATTELSFAEVQNWISDPNRDRLQTDRMFSRLFSDGALLEKLFPQMPTDLLRSFAIFIWRQRDDLKILHLFHLMHSHKPDVPRDQKVWKEFFQCQDLWLKLEQLRSSIPNEIPVNQQDGLGKTPLHEAAFCGYREMVRFLLGKNANPNLVDILGNTPFLLSLVSLKFEEEIVEALYPKDKQFPMNLEKSTPLHLAAYRGVQNRKTIQRLIDDGLDPLQKNAKGHTPLFIARSNQLPVCIEIFSQKIAQTNPDLLDEDSDWICPFKTQAIEGSTNQIGLRKRRAVENRR